MILFFSFLVFQSTPVLRSFACMSRPACRWFRPPLSLARRSFQNSLNLEIINPGDRHARALPLPLVVLRACGLREDTGSYVPMFPGLSGRFALFALSVVLERKQNITSNNSSVFFLGCVCCGQENRTSNDRPGKHAGFGHFFALACKTHHHQLI